MANKDSKKTEVAKKAHDQVALFSGMEEDSNIGRGNMSAQDQAIPYISILQTLSPQVKKGPGRVDGAEEGDIFNSLSEEIWGGEEGLMVIPCAFSRQYVEWAPRTSGGGFQGSHSDQTILEKCDRNELGQGILPNGNIIVTTNYHYCLIINDKEEILERVVIPFSSTQLKKSRKWNSLITSVSIKGANGFFNPPMFACKYHLSTLAESNSKGDWYGWKIQSSGLISSEETYTLAKKFALDISQGLVKVTPQEGPSDPSDDIPY